MEPLRDTSGEAYARRLSECEGKWWKRLLNVQAPYQANLRKQALGRTLDVGCGIGRNLASLDRGSIGVDHNKDSVAVARQRGFIAMTWEEFQDGELSQMGAFDALLFA